MLGVRQHPLWERVSHLWPRNITPVTVSGQYRTFMRVEFNLGSRIFTNYVPARNHCKPRSCRWFVGPCHTAYTILHSAPWTLCYKCRKSRPSSLRVCLSLLDKPSTLSHPFCFRDRLAWKKDGGRRRMEENTFQTNSSNVGKWIDMPVTRSRDSFWYASDEKGCQKGEWEYDSILKRTTEWIVLGRRRRMASSDGWLVAMESWMDGSLWENLVTKIVGGLLCCHVRSEVWIL